MKKVTNYTKEKFIAEVASEVRALKKHAKAKEIKNLNISYFDPKQFTECISGQMTGDCRSTRASELIFSCCKRYYVNEFPSDAKMSVIKKTVNGTKIKGVDTPRRLREDRIVAIGHFSAIEAYILMPWAKPKNIIAYLKGETKELTL
jgi:hypothetical protein